jgi:hypothetical protein
MQYESIRNNFVCDGFAITNEIIQLSNMFATGRADVYNMGSVSAAARVPGDIFMKGWVYAYGNPGACKTSGARYRELRGADELRIGR